MLDQALHDAGIAREETFVTNAVKHFKYEMRGKRRLHKRPNNYEVERCKNLTRLGAQPRQTFNDCHAWRDCGAQPDRPDGHYRQSAR
jgi:hypothetical protein